jgi:hypothetical protein
VDDVILYRTEAPAVVEARADIVVGVGAIRTVEEEDEEDLGE